MSLCACENRACNIFKQKEHGGKTDLFVRFLKLALKNHLGLEPVPEPIQVRGLSLSTEVKSFVRSEKAENPKSTLQIFTKEQPDQLTQ